MADPASLRAAAGFGPVGLTLFRRSRFTASAGPGPRVSWSVGPGERRQRDDAIEPAGAGIEAAGQASRAQATGPAPRSRRKPTPDQWDTETPANTSAPGAGDR